MSLAAKRRGAARGVLRETAWIYRHTRSYRRAIFLFTLLGLLTTALSLGGSLLSRRLINTIVAKQGSAVLQTGLLTLTLAALGIALGALSSHYSARITLQVSNSLRSEVYGIMLGTDWESLQQFHSGDLLSRINTDVTTVANSVLGWVPTLIIRLMQLFSSLAVIVFYDPLMALFALLTAPLTALAARPLLRTLRAGHSRVRQESSRMMAFHEETLQNVQTIQALHLNAAFRERLRRVQEEYYDASMAYQRVSVANSALLSAAGTAVSYLCLGWAAFRLWQGRIDFGTMVLFVQLAAYLSAALKALIRLVPSAVECTVSARRLLTVFDLPREEAQAFPLPPDARSGDFTLCLRELHFSYRQRPPVLDGFSLCVSRGEMVALVGASGAGKTTLFRLMLGLVRPTGGEATVHLGRSTVPLGPATRSLFSYVPQEHIIFSGTVAQNLRLVREDATQEELWAALRVACAEDFVRALPQGLDTPLSERAASLSVGQAQRLAIARAVLDDAPIILLDEVTSALDGATEQRVLANLAALSGKACILATHRPAALALCKRVYRLENGQESA